MNIANRDELLKKIEYITDNGNKINDCTDIKVFLMEQAKIIAEYLKNTIPLNNDDFILCGRAEHCMNEFYRYLDRQEYEMCFYDLYEFIESDKKRLYESLMQRQSGYEYCEYITSKEVAILEKMLNTLAEKLK